MADDQHHHHDNESGDEMSGRPDTKAAMLRALEQGDLVFVDPPSPFPCPSLTLTSPGRFSSFLARPRFPGSFRFRSRFILTHSAMHHRRWNNPFDWDVLVVCGSATWKLHRAILAAESTFFAERLPPVLSVRRSPVVRRLSVGWRELQD